MRDEERKLNWPVSSGLITVATVMMYIILGIAAVPFAVLYIVCS